MKHKPSYLHDTKHEAWIYDSVLMERFDQNVSSQNNSDIGEISVATIPVYYQLFATHFWEGVWN